MTKLSKAQQEVMNNAKERIDFARTHDFYDWFRNENYLCRNYNNEEVKTELDKRTEEGWVGNWQWEMSHYEMNINGIDFKCHVSSKTIKKLEEYGLIEIIKDSNGEYYGLDIIKVLNY